MSAPTEFDKELDNILLTLLNVPAWFIEPHFHQELRAAVIKSKLSPAAFEAIKAIKQAVDKHVIGNTSDGPIGDSTERMGESKLRVKQRQSLWGTK